MFCCLFRKRDQTNELNNKLNNEFEIEQINVLITMDRESERTRSSVYCKNSLYFTDSSFYKPFSRSNDYIIYELMYDIIDIITEKHETVL